MNLETKRIFYIQNISDLLIQLEFVLRDLKIDLPRDKERELILYVISKILLKSGLLNTVYQSEVNKDVKLDLIRSRLINIYPNRYLPNLVIENIHIPALPRAQSGEEIWLTLVGDLLMMKN